MIHIERQLQSEKRHVRELCMCMERVCCNMVSLNGFHYEKHFALGSHTSAKGMC